MKRMFLLAAMFVLLHTIVAFGAEEVIYNGKRYVKVGCYGSYRSPADAMADGEHYMAPNGDIYWKGSSGYLCWRVVGDASGDVTGSGQPAASPSIVVNQMIRQNVLMPAKPKAQPKPVAPVQPDGGHGGGETGGGGAFYENMPGFGRLNYGAADLFVNFWDVGGTDGMTFGINPSMTYGDESELTLTLPVHLIVPDGGSTLFGIGLDGSYKRPLPGRFDQVNAGVHLYGMAFFGDDTAFTFGGGPFVSWSYRFSPKWIVSVGGLLELSKPDEGDMIIQLAPAANLGYNLSDNVALNGYLIHHQVLDGDLADKSYSDVGADVQWMMGTWSLSGGLKTAVGLSNVDSVEAYLGSNWMF